MVHRVVRRCRRVDARTNPAGRDSAASDRRCANASYAWVWGVVLLEVASARPARLPPLKRPACVSPIALEGALDCSLGRFSTLPHGIGWHDPGYCTTNVPTMPFWACPGTAHR